LGILASGGVYVNGAGTNGGSWLGPLPRMLAAALRGLFDRRIRVLTTTPKPVDLQTLLQMVREGMLRPWIGEELTLEDVPEALQRQLAGRVRGKAVIRFGAAASRS
jgi:D-arabinose 1-dehydrogenase-like Zn-dependent alcohol dehydrogenase